MIKVERMNYEKNEQIVELEVAKTEDKAIGIVTIEGDYATITYKRRLSHPREVVWRAITDPKEFAIWFKQQARVFDGHTGGEIDYVNEISGYHATGRVLVWEPPRVFEHEWHIAPRPELPGGEPEAVVRWELMSEGDSNIFLTNIFSRLTKRTALLFAPGQH
ncbi:MAG TPA: SRPBCC domain-containing protein, partial [Nitrososphaeraceae archaeon]|nr:SRPBCC domain-containing protein [Nitrososphaeraceae archaeon]